MEDELGREIQDQIGHQNNMAELYTPQSNTQPGAAQQDWFSFLKSIQTMPSGNSQALGDSAANAQSQALAMQSGEQDFVGNAVSTLTQQSSIPDLQNQQANLASLFPLYLADTQLAQKYAGTGNSNPYANPTLMAQGGGNPYLGSTDALAASGEGVVPPSFVTKAIGEPADAASGLLNTLSGAISGQQDIVNALGETTARNYQSKMKTLEMLASILGNAYNSAKEKEDKSKSELDFSTLFSEVSAERGNGEWKQWAMVQGEDKAKEYAEERFKQYGGDWTYEQRQDKSGWDIFRLEPIVEGAEPERQVRMINWQTGDDAVVTESEVPDWELRGYEEDDEGGSPEDSIDSLLGKVKGVVG